MWQEQVSNILEYSFYQRETIIVAQALIGQILVRRLNNTILAGIITEVEAYGGVDDMASHAFKGKTERTAAMFGKVGRAYIYFIYGNHFCFNIVAKSEEQTAGAVLIRAITPIAGIEYMQQLRGISDNKNLTNGPGKITKALHITKAHNYVDCTKPTELYVLQAEAIFSVKRTARIGISKGQDKQWRFIAQ